MVVTTPAKTSALIGQLMMVVGLGPGGGWSAALILLLLDFTGWEVVAYGAVT